jgi:hypothetical protein
MPNLTEAQNLKLANDLAQKAFQTKRGLNEVIEKVAREMALNPEQIRTLSRLTNVAMFGVEFKNKTGADRQVEFPVSDAEAIILKIAGNPNPPQSATVNNDKLASASDYDLTPARPLADGAIKVASEHTPKPKPTVPRWKQAQAAQKLCEEYTVAKIAAHNKWEEHLQLLTKRVREQPTTTAKIAYLDGMAHHIGVNALPEIALIAKAARVAYDATPEKVAYDREYGTHTKLPDYEKLAAALESRQAYVRFTQAIKRLKEEFPEVQ